MKKRVAIYVRVSTSKQDTENQLRELSAVADRSGWEIWKVYEDAGISGAKGRDKRPGLDAMMKAVNAKQFDLVATWSVDRLGRSLTDLLAMELRDKGVDLSSSAGSRYLNHRRQGDVSDVGRICRVRAGDHSREGQCRFGSREGEWDQARPASGRAGRGGANSRTEGQR
jgi:hypothetical protein